MSNLVVKLADYEKNKDFYTEQMWLLGELVIVDEVGIELCRFVSKHSWELTDEDWEYSHG